MKTQEKEQTNYYQVVNVDKDNNELIMLDYIFEYRDTKGATGTRFEPISKEVYKEMTSKDAVIERIIDCGLVEYRYNKDIKYKFAETLYKEMKKSGEIEAFCFDTSYKEHWDKLRVFGYPKGKYPIFNCTGGGRMFDKNFKGNVSEELNEIIRKAES